MLKCLQSFLLFPIILITTLEMNFYFVIIIRHLTTPCEFLRWKLSLVASSEVMELQTGTYAGHKTTGEWNSRPPSWQISDDCLCGAGKAVSGFLSKMAVFEEKMSISRWTSVQLFLLSRKTLWFFAQSCYSRGSVAKLFCKLQHWPCRENNKRYNKPWMLRILLSLWNTDNRNVSNNPYSMILEYSNLCAELSFFRKGPVEASASKSPLRAQSSKWGPLHWFDLMMRPWTIFTNLILMHYLLWTEAMPEVIWGRSPSESLVWSFDKTFDNFC